MKVAIAGGAGRQCLASIYDFIEHDDIDKILLIDANEDALNIRKELVSSEKIETRVVDINDTGKLSEAISGFDAILNASSHLFNMKVMDACLEARVNYTDLGGLFHWALEQLKMHDDFRKAGITGIVGSGSAPGIVNVFAKYAVDRLDKVDTILIMDAIVNPAAGYKFTPPYALNTIIEEFTANNFEFKDGEMKELPPFSGKIVVDFPEPYGRLNMYNMIHSEVATMPISFREKGIRNVAFKLALPTLFEERLRFLVENGVCSSEKITVKGVDIVPRDVIIEALEPKPGVGKPGDTPKDSKLLRVIAEGMNNGKRVKFEIETDLHHHQWGLSNGMFTVGFPAAITTRMLGSGLIKDKGFFSGEQVIDTEVYFNELKKRNIQVISKLIEEL